MRTSRAPARIRRFGIGWSPDHLDLLLDELKKLRKAGANPRHAQQIREGVELAVKLAGLLQRVAVDGAGAPRAT